LKRKSKPSDLYEILWVTALNIERGYPENLILTTLSEVEFEEKKLVLQPKHEMLFPLVAACIK